MKSADVILRNSSYDAPLATKLVTGQGPGVFCVAVSGTPAAITVPSFLHGKHCRIVASTASVDLLFGDSSVGVTYAAVAAVASGHASLSAASGGHFVAGFPDKIYVPKKELVTHMAYAASGAGFLYIWPLEE